MTIKIEGCVSEFVGTFFLVLTIGYNVLQQTALAPISIGAILTAMIFATGRVSGGHFNPAVTMGVLMSQRKKVDVATAAAYAASQLLGGLLAAIVYMEILGASFTLKPGLGYTLANAVVVELLFSSALVFVVLNVATTAQDDGNWYYGLAIGFTVMAAAFAIGPISGCSLNPAVTFGVMLSHLMHTGSMTASHFLIYLLTPMLGAMLATAAFRIVRAEEYKHEEEVLLPTYDKERIHSDYLAPQSFNSPTSSVPASGASSPTKSKSFNTSPQAIERARLSASADYGSGGFASTSTFG